jgi:4-amino-4-deoxy-L-arabinose transferase-like glycosyltransferase
MTISKIRPKTVLQYFILIVLLLAFFSFRLADTPNGINLDEASYGYNGILLSENLRDAHGRFLPFFILASDNITWYPPYMQYFIVLLFKLFGSSTFVMRFATVIITVISALLTLYFAKLIFDKKSAFITLISFLIIPEVMIETHTPLEHMIVVPFVLLWLINLFKYRQALDNKYLIFAALSLGLGFYSYGGIRPLVAIWILISIAYVAYLNRPAHKLSLHSLTRKKYLLPLFTFTLTALPFFTVILVLEYYYAGAVLNRVSFNVNSIYSYFYYYLASFDISFLFVTGDKLLIQSTLRHGMFLLSTLPIFAIGLYQTFRKESDYFMLLGITFFSSPLLYGFVGSAYFAHRLLYMVPFYTIFFTLGVKEMITNRNRWLRYGCYTLFVLIMFNYFDFWKYYMFDYPKDTYHLFYHLEDYKKPYEILSSEAKNRKLQPFLSARIARLDGININDAELFTRATYFPKLPSVLDEDKDGLPTNGILLSEKGSLADLKRLDSDALPFYLYVR